MVARGRVRDGVIVLENGVQLTEGQEVTVVSISGPAEAGTHGILDIEPVSAVRESPADAGDLLGEMLEGRP